MHLMINRVLEEELHKYNTILKGELTQCKQQLEKLYSSRENIDDSISMQRPTYDKIGIVYIFNMSAKKLEIRSDPKEKGKSDDKIESSQSSDKPKEFGQDKEVEILDEPKQVESPKETSYEFRGKFFSCNEIGHMKRNCTNKSFNHVMDFYFHNCHGMGHRVIDCRKPKYDNDRRNSRMSGNIIPPDRR